MVHVCYISNNIGKLQKGKENVSLHTNLKAHKHM